MNTEAPPVPVLAKAMAGLLLLTLGSALVVDALLSRGAAHQDEASAERIVHPIAHPTAHPTAAPSVVDGEGGLTATRSALSAQRESALLGADVGPEGAVRFPSRCRSHPGYLASTGRLGPHLGLELGCAAVRPATNAAGEPLGVAVVATMGCALCQEVGLEAGDIVTHVSGWQGEGDELWPTFDLEGWALRVVGPPPPGHHITFRVLREGRPALLSRRLERGRFRLPPPPEQCAALLEVGGRAAALATRAGCPPAPAAPPSGEAPVEGPGGHPH